MSDQRKGGIAWTDTTWNPIRGCSHVSPGCDNCYAEQMAARFCGVGQPYEGLIEGGRWNGRVRLVEEHLADPLRWQRPRRIFVNSMSDLFHPEVPDEWLDRIFAVMGMAKDHTFQVLTKRPERMLRYLSSHDIGLRWSLVGSEMAGTVGFEVDQALRWTRKGLPNVWLGVTAENQAEADRRIPLLLQTPAAVRWVSVEPMLGPVDLRYLQPAEPPVEIDALNGTHGIIRPHRGSSERLNWVVCGGESGPRARPMHPDWARSLRDQCQAAGVPFMLKQNGEWKVVYDRDQDDPDWANCPKAKNNNERYVNLAGGHGFHGSRVVFMRRIGKCAAGRLLDGREWLQMPEALLRS